MTPTPLTERLAELLGLPGKWRKVKIPQYGSVYQECADELEEVLKWIENGVWVEAAQTRRKDAVS
jgi:hypothetical protein